MHCAAGLLGDAAQELDLTPAHLFQFPFRYMCVARHGRGRRRPARPPGRGRGCAPAWSGEVLANDAFLTLLA
jgi:hypothetical protein